MSREDPQLRIRLPIELKEKIQDLADKNNRSMNAEIVFILEDYFNEDGLTKHEYINNLHEELHQSLMELISSKKDIIRLMQECERLKK